MASLEVCPTGDAVRALLEYLVDPMLPMSSSAVKVPSIPQQLSVAKQVRAVVLLYNYYQRKQHPGVEFLGPGSFCKLAVTLRPNILPYMKLLNQSVFTELDDVENQLSLTERAVIDACNISLALDASRSVPSTEGWPISKVAVLVIDPKKENCLLLFSSVTNGVWSVIENDVDISTISSESIVVGKHINKKKRISRKPLREEKDADEDGLLRLVYAAVKEATGTNHADLTVLESHAVYSLSKEKTAARFYIVQCNQPIKEDLQVPIKDVIESLQGPLVKKSSGSWTVTPVVEYLHVLPYTGILRDLFYGKMSSDCLISLKEELGNVDDHKSHMMESPCDRKLGTGKNVSSKNLENVNVGSESENLNSYQRSENPSDKEIIEMRNRSDNNFSVTVFTDKEVSVLKSEDRSDENCSLSESFGNKASVDKNSQRTEKPLHKECGESVERVDQKCNFVNCSGKDPTAGKGKDNEGCDMVGLSTSLSGPQTMDVDNVSVVCPQKEERSRNISVPLKVYHLQRKRTSTQRNINTPTSEMKVNVADSTVKSSVSECDKAPTIDEASLAVASNLDGCPVGFCAVVPSEINAKQLEKVKSALNAKEKELLQTALKVLSRKREILSHQLRSLEDEIAACDKSIQTIIDGGEDAMALKIEAIIDCCNELCLQEKSQSQPTPQAGKDHCSPHQLKGKKLSEAILTLRTPCEELDKICCQNNWILPTYRLSPSAGDFLGSVTVKGMDFEYSVEGNLRPKPREARESAAAAMIAKLQGTAGRTL